jgi:uncharacterized membrane protein (DUF485 family)
MRAVAVVVQILVSFVVAASLMPVLLVTVPATQSASVGPPIAIGLAVVAFVLVRLVWPRHRG